MNIENLSEIEPLFPWWMVLLQGIIALIIGIFLLVYPGWTILFLIQVLGIYWFIAGIFSIASIFGDKTNWGWKLVLGILGVVAGILVLSYPFWSTLLVLSLFVILIGIWGVIIGGVNLYQAFKGGGWGMGILGILSLIFGLIILCAPLITTLILPFVLGIFAIFGGFAAIIMSFSLRSAAPS